jgi:membrane protein
VLATAPLLVAISAVTRRLAHRDVSFYITRFLGLHGDSQRYVQALFSRSASSVTTVDLLLGMVFSILFAATVATVQQRGFEMIWTLPRVAGIRSYVRQLVWAPALAAYSVAVLLAGRGGQWIDRHLVPVGPVLTSLLQGALTLLFYWWSQHWLLRGRIRWRSLFPGALAVSLFLVATVQISRAVLPGQIAWQVHAYGEIGAVFMLSIWFMAASVITFLGVLVGALIAERRHDPERRPTQTPGSPPLTEAGLRSAASAEAVAAERDVPINQVTQSPSERLPTVRN